MNELSFVVADNEGSVELVPVVDGVSLVQLVGEYESAHGMRPSGGYGGLIPAHFNFGDLRTYYLGQSERQWPGTGRMWLLGCDCGEVGCWPLEVTTTVENGQVTWTDFRQPHRPAWDFAEFGPFTFEENRYRDAVAGAASAASTRVRSSVSK
ncbi:hypothetical protein [Nocardioides sp. WS12]|uniref:hypothetical protein n=1 Tax=Nocardioides sp. WS12 TaxID=2486272 RepID=UPI0015F97F4F|nr:hypothetical protein [Nocardioides sp. WS12]